MYTLGVISPGHAAPRLRPQSSERVATGHHPALLHPTNSDKFVDMSLTFNENV